MTYFGYIAGILKDPKNERALIEEEHYSAKTVFLTQISILAAIPAIALYIGMAQVGWSVAGQEPVRLASASALESAVLFYFAMWGAVAFIATCTHWMDKTYGGKCRWMSAWCCPQSLQRRCFCLGFRFCCQFSG